jgi:hypothetical protein
LLQADSARESLVNDAAVCHAGRGVGDPLHG